ncbi:hypothetical protein MKX03_003499 [Papaver bracteatum]|nr:hypothetical protein MKX03_003499 [Papaver bracteatum]
MEKSKSESSIFSVRIVSIDHYMSPPITDLDISYSSFQGGVVNEVPVIRIFGSTPAGQKTCLHVHRALPYLYMSCSDISLETPEEGDKYLRLISSAIEKALKLKGSAGNRKQHVHGCSLVRARKFYGYHPMEELFVKIYLYYPHEVARVAKLLLDGAILDKSFQPYESHIPFLLQFMIDHNLYGMGQLHVSKVKFRHPLPDGFTPKRDHSNDQSQNVTEKITSASANFEADPTSDAFLGSPIWISSTIPSGWMWPYPTEHCGSFDKGLDLIKRQSICQLEGDAIVDEILNQQLKLYSSMSQTRPDVKMVQSLIPIWEEEYERTGLHEAPISPDPSKPLPEHVLQTFSHGHKLETAFWNMCRKTDKASSYQNTPSAEAENFMLSVRSLTDVGNLVDSGESSKCPEEVNESFPADAGRSPCKQGQGEHELVPGDEGLLTSEMPETSDSKITDTETLEILRWLASSQAANDLDTDDEFVHELVLSPFIPKEKIDRVLENANLDHESESQKECQDILDSVDHVAYDEDFKDRMIASPVRSSLCQTSSENTIPQVDGSHDDNLVDHVGNTNEKKISNELEGPSYQVREQKGVHLDSKTKKTKRLWGSLPFSNEEKLDSDLECFNSADSCADMIHHTSSHSSSGNKINEICEVSTTNNSTPISSLKEGKQLTGSSVRDLMRKKRRTGIQPCGTSEAKKILLSKDLKAEAYLCPKQLKFHTMHDGEPVPTHGKSSFPSTCSSEVKPSDKVHVGASAVSGIFRFSDLCHLPHDSSSRSVDDYNQGDCPTLQRVPGDRFNTCKNPITAVDVNPAQVDNHASVEQERPTCLSIHDSSLYKSVESKGKPSEGILSKKPCMIDEIKGLSDDLSYQGYCQEKKEDQCKFVLNFRKETVTGVPTLYQNDGSVLYLLTTVFSPPSVDSVQNWLSHPQLQNSADDKPGTPETNVQLSLPESSSKHSDGHGFSQEENDTQENVIMLPESPKPHELRRINTQRFPVGVRHEKSREPEIELCAEPFLDPSRKEDPPSLKTETVVCHPNKTCLEQSNLKDKEHIETWQDVSQISGPDRRSKLTPLSQTGFRDPASVGAGQQLTLLSIEIHTESRGDLRPDPRFDAINVISLAIQEDNDHVPEAFVLLRTNIGESCRRNLDGISGCKVVTVSEEKLLFHHFVKIIRLYDPDVLLGWEIQGGSIGYLAERAAHFGLGLLSSISRMPTPNNKTASGNSASPAKEIPDNLLPEALMSEMIVLEDAIIGDEWGRTHASGVHVDGRIVLNFWRLMRGDIKLNMYTIEAVAEAVLRRKIPSIPFRILTQWFSSGPGRARFRCIEYVLGRAKLNLEIMNKHDLINRTSELARVFGIDFFSVLSRGSQYRVESMLLRLAHTQNYLAISPGNQQVASQPAMECLPLVMEPESGFYADPVVVLDFQSLYPSMIIAYNLCFSTCLGKVIPSKENTLGVSKYVPDPQLLANLKDQIMLTPNGVMYVTSKIRKGVLPRLLEEILSTRIMVKQAMKKLTPSQQVLSRIFNARQLALKLIANVTYGYTAAGFSGRMPCAELADSIVQCGRRTLETAISFVNAHEEWKGRVIYGDTDSMFVLLKGRSAKEALLIGQEIASVITSMNPYPVALKMEKVYHPCFLLTKKRYVGYSYESPSQTEPSFDAKGIETVRRDGCGVVSKTLEQSLRLYFEQQDIFKVKVYLQRQWTRILSGRISLQDFVFAKEVRLGTYSARASSLPPAAIVAMKAMRADPRAEPRYAERIPYVVIHGEPGARLVDMVVDPLDLLQIDSPFRLNDLYYITKQIIPALQRVFGLVGADLHQWFLEMPRAVRPTTSKRQNHAPNGQRNRIDYYYLSKHCILCGDLVQSSTRLCEKCSRKGPAVATAVIGRTSKLERDIQHLAAICGHCGGGDWIVESGVKCTSLACSVFYERRKVQKELNAVSAVATEVGFYPSCMVEWF